MRTGWAVFALLLATAARPVPPLPVPPIPPAHRPMDQLAPVPDPDARAPFVAAPRGTQVDISNFRVRRYDQSLGYGRGSQFQSEEDKRPIQTPGLTIRVPLQ